MIVRRGLTQACPNCGSRRLFPSATSLRMNRECPACGLVFERDEGGFWGAMSLNYGVTVMGFLVPVLGMFWAGMLALKTAMILAGAGGLVVPVLLYRPARGWWLMNYYLVFPGHLPANAPDGAPTAHGGADGG